MEINLPVIDLRLEDSEVAKSLGLACSESGFFVVTNHGVPPELMKGVYRCMVDFFSLSEEQKFTALVNSSNRGFTPFKEEKLDVENQTTGDTKEGYYIGRSVSSEEVRKFPHPLQGENVWPDEEKLGLKKWRETMGKYFEQMHVLGMKLLRLVSMSLNLSEDYFNESFTRPMETLRLLKYGPDQSVPDAGVFGCGAHTDYGMLTLLSTDSIPGLQIYDSRKEQWISVVPRPRDFIVNIGDMLARWTNFKYKSTLHRVVNVSGKERYSIPFFFEPNFEAVVTCLPSVLGEDEVAVHPPVIFGEHLLKKLTSTHDLLSEKS